MTTSTHLITADELWEMPGDQRRELVRGELRMMAPAGFEHGHIVMRLARRLANHVDDNRLGTVLGAETGFFLAHNPDLVRAADVSFVSTARIPNPRPTKFFPGAPDLAVEVLSPGDTIEAVEEKVDDYLTAGTKIVWVVNPRRRTITIYEPNQKPILITEPNPLAAPALLPGLSISLADVFA